MIDKNVEKVVETFRERSRVGISKYGTTLERTDLSFYEWLVHLQQELMDATLYIEKLKGETNVQTITNQGTDAEGFPGDVCDV